MKASLTSMTILLIPAFAVVLGCRTPGMLSLKAAVERPYSDDDRYFHLLKLVNRGNDIETVLTAQGISSGGGSGTHSDPINLVYGLSIPRQIDANGYIQTYSLCMLKPVSLRPGEYANINTGEDDIVEWINGMTGTVYFVFHYEVTEDWGKRLNVWHGVVKSDVISVDFGEGIPASNK